MIAGIRTAIILDSNPPADFPVVAVDASFLSAIIDFTFRIRKDRYKKNGGGDGCKMAEGEDGQTE